MKRNVIPLVVIALAVAILSTGVFYGLIVSRMDGSPATAQKPYFVASHGLEAGRVLRPDDLKLATGADPGGPGPAHTEDAVGRRTRSNIEAGKPILDSLLSPAQELPLRGGIPEGMRAVTIHVSDSAGVVKLLQAGDHVDIQSLHQRPRNGESEVEVRTLMQNATVYQVQMDNAAQTPGRQMLTILSSPEEAERLSAADAGARLRVVLRNRNDQTIVPLAGAPRGTAPTVRPVVQSSFTPGPAAPAAELEVCVWEVESADLDQGATSGALQVKRSELNLADLQSRNKASILASSRLVAGKAGEFTWKAGESATMKVRIEPVSVSDSEVHLRLLPESIEDRVTRRIESIVQLGRQHSAHITGWTTSPPSADRSLLVAVSMAGKR